MVESKICKISRTPVAIGWRDESSLKPSCNWHRLLATLARLSGAASRLRILITLATVWRNVVKVFSLPAHCCRDSSATAGMIVEDDFFQRAGIKFAILAQQHVNLRFGVWLAGSI